jgi:fructokinase
MFFGAIEGGGTKFVCGVGGVATGSLQTTRITTSTPAATLDAVQSFFADCVERHGPLTAVGVASFGPLQLDPRRAGYGCIAASPKAAWSGFDLLGDLRRRLGVPLAIDTDVTAATMAELQHGAGRDALSLAYVTVGTGIGVGYVLRGVKHMGPHRPEFGHLRPRPHPLHRSGGVCAFHGECYEGLLSGPALQAAWGAPLSDFAPEHAAFVSAADHLGQLLAAVVLALAPDRIVVGGGVLASTPGLLSAGRERAAHWLAGYAPQALSAQQRAALIVEPGCHEPSGLVGAYLLAEQGLTQAQRLVAVPS